MGWSGIFIGFGSLGGFLTVTGITSFKGVAALYTCLALGSFYFGGIKN